MITTIKDIKNQEIDLNLQEIVYVKPISNSDKLNYIISLKNKKTIKITIKERSRLRLYYLRMSPPRCVDVAILDD